MRAPWLATEPQRDHPGSGVVTDADHASRRTAKGPSVRCQPTAAAAQHADLDDATFKLFEVSPLNHAAPFRRAKVTDRTLDSVE